MLGTLSAAIESRNYPVLLCRGLQFGCAIRCGHRDEHGQCNQSQEAFDLGHGRSRLSECVGALYARKELMKSDIALY